MCYTCGKKKCTKRHEKAVALHVWHVLRLPPNGVQNAISRRCHHMCNAFCKKWCRLRYARTKHPVCKVAKTAHICKRTRHPTYLWLDPAAAGVADGALFLFWLATPPSTPATTAPAASGDCAVMSPRPPRAEKLTVRSGPGEARRGERTCFYSGSSTKSDGHGGRGDGNE